MSTSPVRVLVTGGSGFIGRRLVVALKASLDVRVLTRHPLPCGFGDGVETIAAGIDDSVALRRAVDGAHVVVHLASVVHRADASRDELFAVNVRGAVRVAEEAAIAGVAHFIFLSSISVVGNAADKIITEETAAEPLTPYGSSKLMAERMLTDVASQSTMALTVLRPPAVYGPEMKGNPLRLFRALHRHVPLPLASADSPRSWLFVDNLVECLRLLCSRAAPGARIYNIADREIVSTLEFTRASAHALGVRPLLLPLPYSLLRAVGRAGERVPIVAKFGFTSTLAESIGGSLVIDTRMLERETGFVPPHSQAEGIAVTAKWFRHCKA